MYDQILDSLQEFDERAFYLFNKLLAYEQLDASMRFLSGDALWVLVFLCLFTMSLFGKFPYFKRYFILILFTVLATDLFCFRFLKPQIARLRPCYQLEDVRLPGVYCGGYDSTPSNHAANSMAFIFSTYLFTRDRRYFWLFFLMIPVGLSRIYLGAHFPLDIFLGWFIGFLFSPMIFYLLKFFRHQYKKFQQKFSKIEYENKQKSLLEKIEGL